MKYLILVLLATVLLGCKHEPKLSVGSCYFHRPDKCDEYIEIIGLDDNYYTYKTKNEDYCGMFIFSKDNWLGPIYIKRDTLDGIGLHPILCSEVK